MDVVTSVNPAIKSPTMDHYPSPPPDFEKKRNNKTGKSDIHRDSNYRVQVQAWLKLASDDHEC